MSAVPAAAGRARLGRFGGLLVKESLQILRDPSSILIALVLPLILLFIFGYGVSLDADRLRIGLVLEQSGEPANDLAAAFEASPFLEVARLARDRREVEEALVDGRLRGVVVIPARFDPLAAGAGRNELQVITDGSEPNTARFVENYSEGVLRNWRMRRNLEAQRLAPAIALEPRMWFNPELRSRFFLVPGSIAIVMTLIGTLLTALVVAREWERGTMEALLATPVGIAELLLGKLIPYFLLGLGSMALVTLLAVWGFAVPMRGSVGALLAMSVAFLLPALGQGLLISAVTRNQYVASQIGLLSGFLPAFLLSGFVFEIASMPGPVRALTYLVPARYFIPSLQSVFLTGDVWPQFGANGAVLVAMGVVLLALAVRTTPKRLD